MGDKEHEYPPTHVAVGVTISRNKMRREKMTARTLPALKYANEKKIKMDLAERKKALEEGEGEEKKTMTITKEDLEGISDKEFAEAKKEDKAKLHSLMDEGFRKAKTKLEELLKKNTWTNIGRWCQRRLKTHGSNILKWIRT